MFEKAAPRGCPNIFEKAVPRGCMDIIILKGCRKRLQQGPVSNQVLLLN